MLQSIKDNIPLWLFESFTRQKGLEHFLSTRIGGVSPLSTGSLNLGFKGQDSHENVLRNRKTLSSALGIPLDDFVLCQQTHGNKIAIITKEMKGRGVYEHASALPRSDGMVTDARGICLVVLVADCAPILFYDRERGVIGAAHAGWRGTLRGITRNAVEVFKKRYSSNPGDILAGIGPSIGPCCYEVKEDFIERLKNLQPPYGALLQSKNGRNYFNLWEANRIQLIEAGLPRANIELAEVCTACYSDIFFSRRRQKGKAGHFAAGIMLT